MSTSKLQTLSGTVTAHDQQEMSVSMYSHLKSLRGATPALTIRAMSPQRVHEQYEKMQQLKKALRRDAADILAQCKVEFIMHAQTPEKDSFDFGSAVADDGEGTSSACDTIVSFLRTHLLDVWRGLAAEELESVHGRLYIFDPFVKARNGSNVNTTWHQDGASLPQADDYFAHYYLPEDEASGLGATDWVEVAIPLGRGALSARSRCPPRRVEVTSPRARGVLAASLRCSPPEDFRAAQRTPDDFRLPMALSKTDL